MKKIPFDPMEEFPPNVRMVDARGNEDETLIEVDKQLKKFGLQIVKYDTESDTLIWKIEKR
jgi:uncharacterized protein YuzE